MTGSRSWSAVQAGQRLTASILASDQLHRLGRLPDRAGVEAGDDTIVLAAPGRMTIARHSARPLVYFQRAYHRTLQVEESRAPGWA